MSDETTANERYEAMRYEASYQRRRAEEAEAMINGHRTRGDQQRDRAEALQAVIDKVTALCDTKVAHFMKGGAARTTAELVDCISVSEVRAILAAGLAAPVGDPLIPCGDQGEHVPHGWDHPDGRRCECLGVRIDPPTAEAAPVAETPDERCVHGRTEGHYRLAPGRDFYGEHVARVWCAGPARASDSDK